MVKILTVYFFLFCWKTAYLQQCQQNTACGNDSPFPVISQKVQVGALRNEGQDENITPKGDEGLAEAAPGDLPKAEVSVPTNVGQVGSNTSKEDEENAHNHKEQKISFDLVSFKEEMRRALAELKKEAMPVTCTTSLGYGRQTLRSGEEIFCDGNWQIIQRRYDGSVNFNRNWNSYKKGFGSLDGEFWLGLDKIHSMTYWRGCRLRVDLWSFDDDHAFAEYSSFSVEDESDMYRLHIAGYSGTAGDSINNGQTMDGQAFTTRDKDNDKSSGKCGANSGWWFYKCTHAALNAPWGRSTGVWNNIVWFEWKGHSQALKATTMKVRCD